MKQSTYICVAANDCMLHSMAVGWIKTSVCRLTNTEPSELLCLRLSESIAPENAGGAKFGYTDFEGGGKIWLHEISKARQPPTHKESRATLACLYKAKDNNWLSGPHVCGLPLRSVVIATDHGQTLIKSAQHSYDCFNTYYYTLSLPPPILTISLP